MGMTLIRSSFAEQIIEKYSILGSYEFGWNSLVFYREGAGQGERASSTYNTELTLKLLLMMQNYKQAGAHTAVNWNLISQTILKHMTGVSGGTERVIREMVRATFTGTERERFLRESITGTERERLLRESITGTEREHIFRELTQEHLTEADRERIFRELTRENLTKTERERIFHELTRESLTDAERERIVQEMLRESLAESEKERIFREVSSGMDRESVYNLAWMLWKEDGAETGGKRGQIPGQRFQKMHLSSYRTISSIQRERARLILSRFRVQQIGREHISRWMELMSESETRQMIGDLKRFTEYYKIQKNRENSREEYSIFQTQNDRWELFEEQLVLLLHKEQSTVELKENFIRLWQEEPEILTALFERILKEETILSSSIKTEHIHGLFRKYEEEVFQKTEQDLRKENIRRWGRTDAVSRCRNGAGSGVHPPGSGQKGRTGAGRAPENSNRYPVVRSKRNRTFEIIGRYGDGASGESGSVKTASGGDPPFDDVYRLRSKNGCGSSSRP
ncbi:MAG: hypothetical protein ACLTKI_05580 [Lachnospiraceae bacterium]